MGQILKSFFIGFFAVFFYKSHVYKQRDRDRVLEQIMRNTQK
jgi:hypothetical protein